jgi:hypothetical protein
VSGGFAIVQPDSVLSINAVEGYPIEDFSEEAVRSQIAEAQKIAGGGGSDIDVAEAKIELEVCGIQIHNTCIHSQILGTRELASSNEVDVLKYAYRLYIRIEFQLVLGDAYVAACLLT